MSVMKRIAVEMISNPNLNGAKSNAEIAAMKKIVKACKEKEVKYEQGKKLLSGDQGS